MLKFYDREKEIALLRQIERKARRAAQMTFVVGRRRIGKTALLSNAFAASGAIYLFVEKKNEALLCRDFVGEIRSKLGVSVHGDIRTFKDVFAFLMDTAKTRRLTVIIDEFQEFGNVNPAIYSSMQNVWDRNKDSAKINLILCGSVYSLMNRIFQGADESLFGRATARMHVKPFGIETLKEIMSDRQRSYTKDDLLAFYMFTGGVAKYVELLADAKAFTLKKITDEMLSENALFLDEGRNVLIDEFGKDYGNYFSILMLIASSKTSRPEMESVMNIGIGGFLDRLENEFGLIAKVRPILSKPGGKSVKYRINDNFLNFWFRFIFKHRSAIEVGNYEYVKDIIRRDYATYSGVVLERYFREKIIAEENVSEIGSYWERGNLNEIDIVALNDRDKRAIIAEVKRKRDNINLNQLKGKAENLARLLQGYDIEYRALSMEDM